MQPLISSDADFAILAIMLGMIALGFWAEQKTAFGKRYTGIVITMTALMIISNIGILPFGAPVYDSVFEDLLPLAIPLLLFRADLRQIVREAGPTLMAFSIGAFGVVLGVLLAAQLVPLGEHAPELAGVFTGTYIGGSANFAAVALASDFQEGATMTAAIAADIVAGNVQMILLLVLPGIAIVRTFYGAQSMNDQGAQNALKAPDHVPFVLERLNLAGLSIAICAAYGVVALGNVSADLFTAGSYGILYATAYALMIANLWPGLVRRMSGDYEAGIFLIFLFLAAIAASADVWTMVDAGPILFLFALMLLSVHMIVVLALGRLFGIGLPEVIIGSTACVGGVTSASAIASAKGWRQLITPGIMAGTLGNAIGSFLGVWVWRFLS